MTERNASRKALTRDRHKRPFKSVAAGTFKMSVVELETRGASVANDQGTNWGHVASVSIVNGDVLTRFAVRAVLVSR
jgi:hypothetical protein